MVGSCSDDSAASSNLSPTESRSWPKRTSEVVSRMDSVGGKTKVPATGTCRRRRWPEEQTPLSHLASHRGWESRPRATPLCNGQYALRLEAESSGPHPAITKFSVRQGSSKRAHARSQRFRFWGTMSVCIKTRRGTKGNRGVNTFRPYGRYGRLLSPAYSGTQIVSFAS